MEQLVATAFRPLPDRDQLRLLHGLIGAPGWSRYRSYDAVTDALSGLADDLAEDEGWGIAAGEAYLRSDRLPCRR